MNAPCRGWNSASAGWNLEPRGHAAQGEEHGGAAVVAQACRAESSSIAGARKIVRTGRGMPVAERAMQLRRQVLLESQELLQAICGEGVARARLSLARLGRRRC